MWDKIAHATVVIKFYDALAMGAVYAFVGFTIDDFEFHPHGSPALPS